jgi:hypothetical protein
MKRLNEPGVRLVPRTPPAPPAPAPTPEPVVFACFRLGPFASVESADKAASMLKERQLAYEQSQEERRTVTGYRLTLPPFPTRQAAEAKRAELTRLGFRDHAILNEEGMRNALSLGVYSVEANAQRQRARLQVKGIKADLQATHQVRTVYWLDLRVPESASEELRKTDWGSSDAALTSEPCPTTDMTAPAEGKAEVPPAPSPPAGEAP